ncbi:nucleotide-binding domain-containing protein [Hesseltinella vesiculosa]|uniref:Nucleotide-binding domain-containing protein n=1 Tax=Hesseltinella vesiculosa TaxID=101127 RepID=A0A1X2GNF3_9FUNG|nr:nucleotide-binding domain-containing protein [Hesseltinella vesiculosa]
MHVVVIGCGVTGLTNTYLLLQNGHKVTLVSKWFPGDRSIEYASPFAGAHWRTMAPNNDLLLQKFDTVGYQKFLEFARTCPDETGVKTTPGIDYYDMLTPETENPWFKDVVENFSFVPANEFPYPEVKVGHRYTSLLINSPQYLTWLLRQVLAKGAQLKRQAVESIHDVFDDSVDTVMNCTGLGALSLGGVEDRNMFPTRGQTILVQASHIKPTITCIRNGTFTYLIPRADGTLILGGTSQPHDYNDQVDELTSQGILARTQDICPDLTKGQPLKVLRHNVGRRPTRQGGVRIENQVYSRSNGTPIMVTHAYGHGGFGYQSSWGAAEHAVALLEKGAVDKASKL